MSWSEIALICVSVVLVVVLILLLLTIRNKNKENSDKKVEDLEIIDGVRYTKNDKVLDNEGEA